MIEQRETDVTALRQRSTRCLGHRLERADGELAHTLARLRALSPAATLRRGYAIVHGPDGAVVRSPTAVSTADRLRIRLADGELAAVVEG
jgi:exodeoxyribonuclease VII large subunit